MRYRYLIISIVCFILGISTLSLLGATGTPSNLVVRTDANNYLLVTAVTQTNPVTQGVFSSRTLRTDSNGSLQVVLTGTVTPTYPMSIPASTCAAPSLGESGAATTGIAFTATPSILNCISGTAVTTLTASSLTSTVPIHGITNLRFGHSATNYWNIDSSANFAPMTNGGFDLGTTSFRVRTNYLGATFTTDVKQIDGTVTWNNAGVTFTGWKLNVTDSASNSASLLMDLQVASASIFSVRKDGVVSSARFDASNTSGGFLNNGAYAIATTSTDGVLTRNTTAAVVGTQVQMSPRVRLSGNGWDVDDAVSRTVSAFMEVLPVAGNTVNVQWQVGVIDPVSSALTYPLRILNGNASAPTLQLKTDMYIGWLSASNLRGYSNGSIFISENDDSSGVEFNTGNTVPSVTSCGTGTITSGSRNLTGQATATGATACTITFGAPAWANAPFCTITLNNAPTTTPYVSARSTTAITVSGLTAGDVFTYNCFGRT